MLLLLLFFLVSICALNAFSHSKCTEMSGFKMNLSSCTLKFCPSYLQPSQQRWILDFPIGASSSSPLACKFVVWTFLLEVHMCQYFILTSHCIVLYIFYDFYFVSFKVYHDQVLSSAFYPVFLSGL